MQSDLNETDSLLRLWAWILDHTKQLITGAVVALIIGLAIYAVFAFQEGKETQAAHALAGVQPPRTRDSQPPTDLAQKFLKVAEDYKGTRAGTLATLRAASSLFAEGKYAEAQAQFERFISLAPGSPFAAQAAYGIAASLEAGGKVAEAQTKYDEVAKRYSTDAVADDAKLALAGIFTSQNKPEQAHKILDELMQATRGSAASQAAFMKRNELEQKFPHLRTNTPPIRPAMPAFPTNILSTATSVVKQASAAGSNLLNAASNAVLQPKAP